MRKVSNPMTETIENTANLPYKNPESKQKTAYEM